jgi:predicted nucleotidyltransferase
MNQSYNDIIVTTLQEYHPEHIGIFGSYARGDQNENSDIDILVKFEDEITLLQLIRLENELSERLGIKVDLVTEGALTSIKIKDAIYKDLTVIYEQ